MGRGWAAGVKGQAPCGTEERGAQVRLGMSGRCVHVGGVQKPWVWELGDENSQEVMGQVGGPCAGLGWICPKAHSLGLSQGEAWPGLGGAADPSQGPERAGRVVLSPTPVLSSVLGTAGS